MEHCVKFGRQRPTNIISPAPYGPLDPNISPTLKFVRLTIGTSTGYTIYWPRDLHFCPFNYESWPLYHDILSNYFFSVTRSQGIKLEGTHWVRTHAVLKLTLPPTLIFDLSTQNHTTCRISQGHSLYQVWTLWDHSFLSYAADKQTNYKRTDSKILPTPTYIVTDNVM